MRISAREVCGYSYEEIAQLLEHERGDFKHIRPPREITTGWVSRQIKRVREEILAVAD